MAKEQQSALKMSARRKLGWISAILLAVSLCLLVVTPLAISYGLQQWLTGHGADEVRIEDVDFNPFLGTSEVTGLDVIKQDRTVLSIPALELTVSWRALFAHHLQVESLMLNGLDLVIEQMENGSYQVGGIEFQGTADGEKSRWGLGLSDFDLVNSHVTFRSPDQYVESQIDSLELNDLVTWDVSPATFKFSGKVNHAVIDVDGHLQPLGDVPGFNGRITIQDFADAVNTGQYKLRRGRAEWNGLVEFGGQVTALGSLALNDVQLTSVDDLPLLEFKKLATEQVEMTGLDAVVIERMQLTGLVVAESPETGDEHQAGQAAVMVADSIGLTSLAFSDGHRLSIDRIELGGVQAALEKGDGGRWLHEAYLAVLSTQDDVAAASPEHVVTEPDLKNPFQVKINTIEVTGDSTVTYHDRSTAPIFKTKIHLDKLVLSQLDSLQPDKAGKLQLKSRINSHSKLDINGKVNPFSKSLDVDLEIKVKALELPPLSSYTVTTIGHRLDSGQVDVDSAIKIKNGKLAGGNKLVLHGLTLSPVENASREKMEAQMAVPLNTALGMLRDKRDVIRLDLPVSGNLDSPDFDISDAINQAVGKALKKGALTYLTLALQPYGALITIAQIAGDVASSVKLDPVVFPEGEATLDESSNGYLDKVAGILKDRPDLDLRLCGIAVKGDRLVLLEKQLAEKGKTSSEEVEVKPRTDEELLALLAQAESEISDEQLLQLADERDNVVKHYLVSEHELDTSRLVACQHSVDAGEEAKPRVDLLL